MVNFIFHSSNGTWNNTKKRYEYNLTNRIDRPKIFKLEQVSLIPSTTPTYPHVVYLKSENLSRIIKTKHTVIAKGDSNQHDIPSDCIGVLTETHMAGRYSLKIPRTFRLIDDPTCTMIDFSLEAPDGTILNGPYTAPMIDTFAALQASFTAGSVKVIWDTDFAGAMVKEGGGNADTVGDLVHQFKARLPSDESAVLTRSSVNGLQLIKTSNGNTFGITTAPNANWESMYDANIGFVAGSSGSFFILWETDSSLPNLEIIAKLSGRFDCVLYGGKIQVRSSTNTYHPAIYNILASTAYIIEIQWTQNVAVYDYVVNVHRLSDGVDLTGSVNGLTQSGSGQPLYIGTAQSTLDSCFSSMVLCVANSTAREQAKSWLQAKYSGNNSVADPDPDGVAADLSIQLHVA
jgi:hypothetical protein